MEIYTPLDKTKRGERQLAQRHLPSATKQDLWDRLKAHSAPGSTPSFAAPSRTGAQVVTGYSQGANRGQG